MSAFPRTLDVPLIARRARRDRREVREHLALGASDRLVLLSFGGFGAGEIGGLDCLTRWPHVRFVGQPATIEPRRLHPEIDYTDLVAASDVVLTKPGFSMFAEALANRVPILYVPRADFAEAATLVTGIEQMRWPCAEVPLADLRSGASRDRTIDFLATISDARFPEVRADGARIVADHLEAFARNVR